MHTDSDEFVSGAVLVRTTEVTNASKQYILVTFLLRTAPKEKVPSFFTVRSNTVETRILQRVNSMRNEPGARSKMTAAGDKTAIVDEAGKRRRD